MIKVIIMEYNKIALSVSYQFDSSECIWNSIDKFSVTAVFQCLIKVVWRLMENVLIANSKTVNLMYEIHNVYYFSVFCFLFES